MAVQLTGMQVDGATYATLAEIAAEVGLRPETLLARLAVMYRSQHGWKRQVILAFLREG